MFAKPNITVSKPTSKINVDLEDNITLSVNDDESDVALARLCRIFRSIREYTKTTINYPADDIRYMRTMESCDESIGYLLILHDKNISLYLGKDMNTIISFTSLGRHRNLLPNNLAGSEYYETASILKRDEILPEILELISDYRVIDIRETYSQ